MKINEYVVVDHIDEAYQLLNSDKKNKIIGGGAWIKLSVKKANKLISLDHLSLDYIKDKGDSIEVGSTTSLRTLETNPMIKSISQGILSKAISKIMGVSIRNLASISGSIMGKFSFSDIIPVLLVLNCKLYFHNAGQVTIEEFISTKDYDRDVLTHIRLEKQTYPSYFNKVLLVLHLRQVLLVHWEQGIKLKKHSQKLR